MLKTRDHLLTEDQRKTLEIKQKGEAQKQRRLASDLNETFGSAAGMNVLRWLMDECGLLKPSVVYNKETFEVSLQATVYNEARRNLYLQIRKNLSPEITKKVEHQGLVIDEVDIFS